MFLTENCWLGSKFTRIKNEFVIKNIMSARGCGDECRKRSSCTFWTWHTKGAGTAAYHCKLGEGKGYKRHDPNVLYGYRECLKHSKYLYYCLNLLYCLQPLL